MEGHAKQTMRQIVQVVEELVVKDSGPLATAPGFSHVQSDRFIQAVYMSNGFYGFAFLARVDERLNRIAWNDPEEKEVKKPEPRKG